MGPLPLVVLTEPGAGVTGAVVPTVGGTCGLIGVCGFCGPIGMLPFVVGVAGDGGLGGMAEGLLFWPLAGIEFGFDVVGAAGVAVVPAGGAAALPFCANAQVEAPRHATSIKVEGMDFTFASFARAYLD
jgi:hypothetical protein